ncbi:MAG: hypothetical protein V3T17_04530 [Pseudomonadales bacterium]
MSSLAFDTHAFVKSLTHAGMPEQQAEVLAEQQKQLLDEQLATKQDIFEIKRDIAEFRAEVKRDIAEASRDTIKWVAGLLIGQAALVVALIKLL